MIRRDLLFFRSCLRSWLEQDRSCPTCRVNLGETQETPSNEANWQPAVKTPQNMDLSPFVRNRGERRRNNLFRFDGKKTTIDNRKLTSNLFFLGRQLASWLPIFSVQVVQEGRQRPVTQMERMVLLKGLVFFPYTVFSLSLRHVLCRTFCLIIPWI